MRVSRQYRFLLKNVWSQTPKGYYIRTVGKKSIYLHREIMARKLGRPLERGEVVHHRDGDTGNNTLSNLRVTTNRINTFLRTKPNCNNKTGHRGVFERPNGTYYARVRFDGACNHLGSFADKAGAINAVDTFLKRTIRKLPKNVYRNEQPQCDLKTPSA